jgi:hypothetical protein
VIAQQPDIALFDERTWLDMGPGGAKEVVIAPLALRELSLELGD